MLSVFIFSVSDFTYDNGAVVIWSTRCKTVIAGTSELKNLKKITVVGHGWNSVGRTRARSRGCNITHKHIMIFKHEKNNRKNDGGGALV